MLKAIETQNSDLEFTSGERKFSFAEARKLVGDLQKPNAKIYWIDFLATIITGHIAFHLVWLAPRIFPQNFSLALATQVVAFPITVVLYLRAAMFIHELVHLPKDEFRGFRIVWNMFCGIFFLLPSFMYYTHVDHHRRKHYGTEHDGEYLSLSRSSPWWIVGFMAQNLILPILGFLRFAVISPICWIVPGARSWVHRHASSMVVDPFYLRPDATPKIHRMILLQEFFCFLWCVWFIARVPVVMGVWFDTFWVWAYVTGVTITTLNALRTLGAHRWIGDGAEMSFEDQLLDSVNYPDRPWITELWGPVGTRYHALHHLFPTLPYHNMPEAHRRLMAGLPADSPYRDTNRTSLINGLRELWQRSRESSQRPEGPASPFRRTAHSDAA